MNPNDLVESKWMKAEDFGRNGVPKEPTVTIKAVKKQKMSKSENWGVFHFREEWAKPLKANTTSKLALERMFGDRDTDDWVGKRLTLWAKPGVYPGGKRIAVRIKGSPDIKQTFSFSVRGFGGDSEVYNLVPTGKNVQLGPGVVRFGMAAGHYGKPFSDFTTEELEQLVKDAEAFMADPKNDNKGKGWPDLVQNVTEIRNELASRAEYAQVPAPPEEPEEPAVPL